VLLPKPITGKLPVVLNTDFPARTIHAPHFVAEELRTRLAKTNAQFSVITIDEQELRVSSDVFKLTRPPRESNFRSRNNSH
jgi:hypothetical protein